MNEIHAPQFDELSSELSQRQPDDPAREVEIAAGSAETSVPAPSPLKPKKKRAPRPTFEDGELTRVFKFPSKKYPKSSYYVTDTEIIIRIRKARKKWKLILPKKRVVSCKTNRWFTKPRWIEIELTYTQAVRQGLHEPTPQPVRLETAEFSEAAPLPALRGDVEMEGLSTLALSNEATAGSEVAGTEAAGIEAESAREMDADADNEADAELGVDEITGWIPDDDLDPQTVEESGDADDEFEADDQIDEVRDIVTSEGIAFADDSEGDDRSVAVESDEAPAEVIDAAPVESAVVDQPVDRSPVEDVTVRTPEAAFEGPVEITVATIFDRPIDVPVDQLSPLEMPPVAASDEIAAPAAVASEEDEPPRPAPIPFSSRVKPKRRYVEQQLLAATLALAILSVSADWSRMADSTADNGSCANAPYAACENQAIVTGSIDAAATAPAVEVESPVQGNSETQPAEPVGPVEPAQVLPAAPAVAAEVSTLTQIAEASTDSTTRQAVVVAMNAEAVVGAPAAPLSPAAPLPDLAAAPVEARPSQSSAQSGEIELCHIRASSIAKSTVVQFGFASATLHPFGVGPLEELASTLRQCPAVHVMIEGHTDSDGDYYRNQSLSVRRAEAVRQHLVNVGVGVGQLSIIGFGQIRPLAPNDSATNKSKNRRIELVIQ